MALTAAPRAPRHTDPAEEAALLDAIERWLEKEVRPQVMRLEHDDIYPRQMVETMKRMGLFGAVLDPRWGGLGLSASTYAKIVMQISTVWMSLTGIFNSHLMMAILVERYGTGEQQARFLPRMASGELRGGSAWGSVLTSTAQQPPSMPLLIQVLVPFTT